MYKVAPQIAEVLCTVSTKRDKKTKERKRKLDEKENRMKNESNVIMSAIGA